jgi:hypothetical protein
MLTNKASSRFQPSLAAYEFVHREVLQSLLDVSRRFFRGDFIVCDNFINDLRGRHPFLETLPNQHRRFVDLVIPFCVQIDQDPFRTVEFGEHYVFVRGWICITHEHFLMINRRAFPIRGVRKLDYRCLTA